MSETTEQATELVDRAEIIDGEALVKYSNRAIADHALAAQVVAS